MSCFTKAREPILLYFFFTNNQERKKSYIDALIKATLVVAESRKYICVDN